MLKKRRGTEESRKRVSQEGALRPATLRARLRDVLPTTMSWKREGKYTHRVWQIKSKSHYGDGRVCGGRATSRSGRAVSQQQRHAGHPGSQVAPRPEPVCQLEGELGTQGTPTAPHRPLVPTHSRSRRPKLLLPLMHASQQLLQLSLLIRRQAGSQRRSRSCTGLTAIP